VRLDKKHQRADWSMRPLTADMLDYAAQDTRWLLDLRDRLREQLEGKERLHWAREEFARLEGTRWPDDDPSTAFLRVKGARDLTRRELAILRELVPWRDGIARGLDRATFRVASNDVLLEVARQAPTTREALAAIKGVPRGSLEARAGEMLEGVRRGLAVPEAELPRFPRGARWDRDPDFEARAGALRTVRDEAAQRLALDPGVLFSRERLETVARRLPRTLDELAAVPDVRAWQVEVLGDAVLRALARFKGASTMPQAAAADTADGEATDGRPADADRSPYRDA
jgi:ribonuclease D